MSEEMRGEYLEIAPENDQIEREVQKRREQLQGPGKEVHEEIKEIYDSAVKRSLDRQMYEDPDYLVAQNLSLVMFDDRTYVLPSYGRKDSDLAHDIYSPKVLGYAEALVCGILDNRPVIFFTDKGMQSGNSISKARSIITQLTGIPTASNTTIINCGDLKSGTSGTMLERFVEKCGHLYSEEYAQDRRGKGEVPNEEKKAKKTCVFVNAQLLDFDTKKWIEAHLQYYKRGNLHLQPNDVSPLTIMLVDRKLADNFYYNRPGVNGYKERIHEYFYEGAVLFADLPAPKSFKVISKKVTGTIPMANPREHEGMNEVFDLEQLVFEEISKQHKSIMRTKILRSAKATNTAIQKASQSSKVISDIMESVIMRVTPETLDLSGDAETVKSKVRKTVLEVVDGLHHTNNSYAPKYADVRKTFKKLIQKNIALSGKRDTEFAKTLEKLTGNAVSYNEEGVGKIINSIYETSDLSELVNFLFHRGRLSEVANALQGKEDTFADTIRSQLLETAPKLYFTSLIGTSEQKRVLAGQTAIKMAVDMHKECFRQQKANNRPLEVNGRSLAARLIETPKFLTLMGEGLRLLENISDEAPFKVLSSYLEKHFAGENATWLAWRKIFNMEFKQFKKENFPNMEDDKIYAVKNIYEAQFYLMTILHSMLVGDNSVEVEHFKDSLIAQEPKDIMEVTNPVPHFSKSEAIYTVIRIYTPKTISANMHNSFQKSLDTLLIQSDANLNTEEAWARREKFEAAYKGNVDMMKILLDTVTKSEKYLRTIDLEASVRFRRYMKHLERTTAN